MWFEEEKVLFDSTNGIYKVHGKIIKPSEQEIKGNYTQMSMFSTENVKFSVLTGEL